MKAEEFSKHEAVIWRSVFIVSYSLALLDVLVSYCIAAPLSGITVLILIECLGYHLYRIIRAQLRDSF